MEPKSLEDERVGGTLKIQILILAIVSEKRGDREKKGRVREWGERERESEWWERCNVIEKREKRDIFK